ncbi:hypothetical protein G3N95_29910 [Paraburkholderia sp. Tr-20389]|uniref:hypothetical protein n=1 Tax=Paraburkholderia sp. Tr-20389 TaxID=2703903 RepID=UPI00197EC9AD|nr:hypothetical protein [Paraburkholderia sp. Tr-20389]MBN3757190.1 hypothetical protein [Paraburkholderia sp. Tr-20389]
MSFSNFNAIIEFLKARPLGATTREIAGFLETTDESANQTMERLFARGSILRGEGARLSAPWTLANTEITPPVFKAAETLLAMQKCARRIA